MALFKETISHCLHPPFCVHFVLGRCACVCAAFLWKEAPGDVEGLHDGVKSRCGRAKDVKAAYGQTKCCEEGSVPRLCGSIRITAWHAVMIWHPQCVCARIRLALCLCSVMHVHGTRCLLEMCGR